MENIDQLKDFMGGASDTAQIEFLQCSTAEQKLELKSKMLEELNQVLSSAVQAHHAITETSKSGNISAAVNPGYILATLQLITLLTAANIKIIGNASK